MLSLPIQPMLPTLVHRPPSGPEWLHEIKYDGYRTVVVVQDGRAKAFTRNGHEWTPRYAAALTELSQSPTSFILDGEMVCFDRAGKADFRALQTSLSGRACGMSFVAFDLLSVGGSDLRDLPLTRRREALEELLPPTLKRVSLSKVQRDGEALFNEISAAGGEGVVSKHAASSYSSGRNTEWRKTKCFIEGEFLVLGAEQRPSCATALLARQDGATVNFVGGALLALPKQQEEQFWRQVSQLRQGRSIIPLPRSVRSGTVFLKPGLTVTARYLRGSDKLRHPVVVRLALPGRNGLSG